MVETNISADTPENLLFRTGSITLDGVNIGALEGDITFRVEREYDIPRLAPLRGEAKGTRRIRKESALLTATLAEWDLANLALAIQGVGVSSDTSSQLMGSDDADWCIPDTDYHELVFTTRQCDDYESIITMQNVTVESDFELTFRDKGHFTMPVTFKTTVPGGNPRARTWSIYHETLYVPPAGGGSGLLLVIGMAGM